MVTGDDRGQAHALEAITAGMLLLASVLFALQVTAVTPLTGSTSSQHIENQQGELAEGVLATAAENDTVVPTLLYWNESGGRFHGAPVAGYHGGGPPTAFGDVLDRTLRQRNIAFDVNVYYVRGNGDRERQPMVDLGSPSDHASTATRSFTLYDDDRIRNEDGSAGPTLESVSESESESYFAPDAAPDSRVYNVVDVEVTVWRM